MSSLPIIPVTVASAILILSLILWWTVVQKMFHSPKPASQQPQSDQPLSAAIPESRPNSLTNTGKQPDSVEPSRTNKIQHNFDRSQEHNHDGQTNGPDRNQASNQHGSQANRSNDESHHKAEQHSGSAAVNSTLANSTLANSTLGNSTLGNSTGANSTGANSAQTSRSTSANTSQHKDRVNTTVPDGSNKSQTNKIQSNNHQSNKTATSTLTSNQKSGLSKNGATEKDNTTQYRTAAKTNNALSRSEASLQISTPDKSISPHQVSTSSNITPIINASEKSREDKAREYKAKETRGREDNNQGKTSAVDSTESRNVTVHLDPARSNAASVNRIGKQPTSQPSKIELALSKKCAAQPGNDTVKNSAKPAHSQPTQPQSNSQSDQATSTPEESLTESQLRSRLADSEDMVARLEGALKELSHTRQQLNPSSNSGTVISPSASIRPPLLSKLRILDSQTG